MIIKSYCTIIFVRILSGLLIKSTGGVLLSANPSLVYFFVLFLPSFFSTKVLALKQKFWIQKSFNDDPILLSNLTTGFVKAPMELQTLFVLL